MQARLKTRLSCPKGLPPNAMHFFCKLVGPKPVQKIYLQQQQTPLLSFTATTLQHGGRGCPAHLPAKHHPQAQSATAPGYYGVSANKGPSDQHGWCVITSCGVAGSHWL